MAESFDDVDDWSAEEDDLVRRALLSLGEDVEANPLPGSAAITGVGMAVPSPRSDSSRSPRASGFVGAGRSPHGRRRNPWVVGGLGLAAASLAVAAVGLSGVLRGADSDPGDPASSAAYSSTTAPTASTSSAGPSNTSPSSASSSASEPDWAGMLAASDALLPTAPEWQAALGVAGTLGVAPNNGEGDNGPLCLMPLGEGVAKANEKVQALPATEGFAGQRSWSYLSADLAVGAFNAMTETLNACAQPTLTPESTDVFEEHPTIWSFSTGGDDKGWVVLTQAGKRISYLEIWASPNGDPITLPEVARLSLIAGQRLQAADLADSGGSTTDEAGVDRVVIGPPEATVADRYFLDPAAFASPGLTSGRATIATSFEFEGSPAVVGTCDPDTDPAGVFGIMRVVETGGNSGTLAWQRVRDAAPGDGAPGDGDADQLATTEAMRIAENLAGCATSGTTVTPGPSEMTYVVSDANGSTFVAVTKLATAGYVSTIAIPSPDGPTVNADTYWAELDRLAALAAKR